MPKETPLTDAQLLEETMSTPGWIIIEKWLQESDTRITNAIRKELINMKWSEKDKWFAFYSGQANIIDSLNKFLEHKRLQPTLIERARKWKRNRKTIDSL